MQFTCKMLRDQGASVITIENNKEAALNINGDLFAAKGQSQTIKLDLKVEKDREFLLTKLIPISHVIIESYRPGIMEKLGLGPDVVHKINP